MTNKGFGKADQFIIRTIAPYSDVQAKAKESVDPANLSDNDWAFLAKDSAIMCSVFVAHEFPEFESRGGHFYREEDGSVTGLSFLFHAPTQENVGLSLSQDEAGFPTWSVDEVFTVNASGRSDISQEVLEAVAEVAEKTLNQQALAFTVRFDGDERGMYSGYAWGPHHACEKANLLVPDGSKMVGPVAMSKHETTTQALCFAYCLNKTQGVLFGGIPYEKLPEMLATKRREK